MEGVVRSVTILKKKKRRRVRLGTQSDCAGRDGMSSERKKEG